jgi:ABC-type lipoprotein export system ATPase subunit
MAGFHCMNGVSQDHKVVQESTNSENIGLLLLIQGLQESQAHSWMKTFNFQVSKHLFVGNARRIDQICAQRKISSVCLQLPG